MALTPLQTRIVRQIVAHIRREQLPLGTHLIESSLAQVLNASRTPVKAALLYLTEKGMLHYHRNRGFYLDRHAHELGHLVTELATSSEDPLYQKIVDMRLARRLPEQFSEVELMRECQVSRSVLRNVLTRIQQEGWLEFRTGQGWRTTPIIDSVAAYEESFTFRLLVEPVSLLSPQFHIDRQTLDACRKQQEDILNGGYLTLTPHEMFDANTHFHETLLACSGNRFAHHSLQRINQLRRLVEYRQGSPVFNPKRLEQIAEHLDILDCLQRGERETAAERMKKHLEKACHDKVSIELFR
ncbi:GntR family transcriptional regulator [Pectobacterium aroidearum]|uniref:GntR family transcriptional regulator n=1 Tax=Pectobacterium aroidearum TaxID=1201031 RepID=UPI0015DE14DA|nr:GntR family transcriptional regulator [Pectobacterium aroidearum]MBA0203803.1 GntR family transcriptional regulator [Pectobacterium aroidearum]